MPFFRVFLVLAVLCALFASPGARGECGGTTQCIGVGPTVAEALVAHHGLGPNTFTMAFGDQPIGSASASRTIFVEAVTGPVGTMATLAPATITGADGGAFLISGGTCTPANGPVHGGPGCTLLVAFSPVTTGPKSATVHVNLAFPGCVGCITERVVTVTGNGVSAPVVAPVANPFTVDVPFGTSRAIDLAPNISGAFTSVSLNALPSHGTATLSGSVVTYVPTAGYFGPDSFAYSASSPGGTSPPATVRINVVSPGAPTAAPRTVSTAFGTPVAIDLAASVTGVFTSVAIASPPANGTATLNGTVVTYRPNATFSGTDSFTYTATGPGGTSGAAAVTVNVVASPPTAAPASLTVQINTPTTLDLAGFVTGSGVNSLAIGARPAHGSVTTSGLKITYTPALDYFGPDSFTYSAVGVAGTSPPATVTVSVVGRPDPTRNPTVTGLLAAQAAAGERFSQAQIANVHGRMESLHRRDARPAEGQSPPSAQAFLQNSYASAAPLPLASEAVSLLSNGSLHLDHRWTNFWVSGNARFGVRGATSAMQSLEFATSGVSLGADRRFGDQLAAGVGIGYARDRTAVGAEGSSSRARGFSVAGYASYQPTRQSFVDALVGFGSLDFKHRRFVAPVSDFATGSRDGKYVFGSLAAGYEYRGNGMLFSPYGRLDHSQATLDGASESGAGVYALSYGRQRSPATQGALGLRAETLHQTEMGWTNLRARGEFRHAFQDPRSSSIAYVDIPGTSYTYAPPGAERNSLVLGLGAELVLRGGLTAGVEYQFVRGSARDNEQGVRLYLSQDLDARGTAAWLRSFRLEPTHPRDLQVDAGFTYDDNVTRSQASGDRRADGSFGANVRATEVFELSPHIRATANAVAGGERFRKYVGLSKGTLGFEGEIQYRPSGGFGAPTFAAFLNAYADAYESHLRDGSRYSAGFSVRKALTDRASAFAAYTHSRRAAKGAVFDGRDHSARLNFDYQWGSKDTLYVTGEYRRGHVVGSGAEPAHDRPFPHTHDYDNVAIESPDDAFPGLDYHAYRFKGNSAIATVGYNWALGARESIDLSWRRVETKARGKWGIETLYGTVIMTRYTTNQFLLLYLVSF